MILFRRGKEVIWPGRPISKDLPINYLYHYTSFESFVKIWHNKTLKFSVVTNLNDILESNFSVLGYDLGDIELMDRFLERRKSYKQISLCMDFDSYTKGCMSPMMWGQYSGKGNGVCIELDFAKLKERLRPSMLYGSVEYSAILPTPPIANDIRTDIDEYIRKNQKQLFFMKHDSWRSENEFRIVSKEDDFLNISQVISSIYITKKDSAEAECIKTMLTNEKDIYFEYVHTDYVNGEFLIAIDNVERAFDNKNGY